jgi:hypothetical protein
LFLDKKWFRFYNSSSFNMTTQITNTFPALGKDLRQRFLTPVGQVSFWVYLLIGVVLFGGVPIWVEVVRYFLFHPDAANPNQANPHLPAIRTAINAYFPAIGCAAAIQLSFAGMITKKYLAAFGLFTACIFAGSSALALIYQQPLSDWTSLLWGGAFSLLAILQWWIANGLDETFQDAFNPEAAVGGSPASEVKGSVEGFTV